MPENPRISTIDGWRGVAILILLLSHSIVFYHVTEHFPGGVLAVDLFFVISGFIITNRLLEEENRQGALARFYFRRAFRILPPVFLYLLTLCVISLHFPIVSVKEVVASLFFYRNYQLAVQYQGDYTMHFWSLSIEEHFYLLWPAILLLARRNRALPVAIIGALASALWRIYDSPTTFLTRHFPAGQSHAYFRVIRTDQRLDGLLVGCVFAILLSRTEVRSFIFRNFPKETPILCAFPLFLILLAAHGFPKLTIYVLMAISMSSSLIVHQGLAYRFLNWRPLVWIGQLSYSLYIWQQLFLFHFWQHLFLFKKRILPISDLGMIPVNLSCAFICAICSYYFVEQPCIALGKRLLRKRHESLLARSFEPTLTQ